MLRLSKRLQIIANHISGGRVIDIGTDHAQLPIYLLEQEKIEAAIGIDRSDTALLGAKRNQERSFAGEKLQLILADGLADLSLQPTDTIVLAGMGGKNMIDILSSKNIENVQQIVVQPNTDIPFLRKILSEKGWRITFEDIIESHRKFYFTMSWERGREILSPKEIFMGTMRGSSAENIVIYRKWCEKKVRNIEAIHKQRGKLSPLEERQKWWLSTVLR